MEAYSQYFIKEITYRIERYSTVGLWTSSTEA